MAPGLIDLLEIWLNNRRGWKIYRREPDDIGALGIIWSDFRDTIWPDRIIEITVWPDRVVGRKPRLFKDAEIVKIYIADPKFFQKLQELMDARTRLENFEKLIWMPLDVIGHLLRWKK